MLTYFVLIKHDIVDLAQFFFRLRSWLIGPAAYKEWPRLHVLSLGVLSSLRPLLGCGTVILEEI